MNNILEIHAAAKETVALAEERFMSNSHNWPFDNAWQEMLNHATIKVLHYISLRVYISVCTTSVHMHYRLWKQKKQRRRAMLNTR